MGCGLDLGGMFVVQNMMIDGVSDGYLSVEIGNLVKCDDSWDLSENLAFCEKMIMMGYYRAARELKRLLFS